MLSYYFPCIRLLNSRIDGIICPIFTQVNRVQTEQCWPSSVTPACRDEHPRSPLYLKNIVSLSLMGETVRFVLGLIQLGHRYGSTGSSLVTPGQDHKRLCFCHAEFAKDRLRTINKSSLRGCRRQTKQSLQYNLITPLCICHLYSLAPAMLKGRDCRVSRPNCSWTPSSQRQLGCSCRAHFGNEDV